MTRRIVWGLWSIAAILGAGIALVSSRYLAGVGPLAPNVLANLYADPWLLLHVAGGVTALLLAALQLLPGLRRATAHRWIGRVYVAGCVLGGVAGLFLAAGSTAGPTATAGFGLLAMLWLAVTLAGWQAAHLGRFEVHRAFMVRSFALTFAAVTLRLYLPLIPLAGVSFVEGYRAISFLCWVPNLLVAEIYLAHRRQRLILSS